MANLDATRRRYKPRAPPACSTCQDVGDLYTCDACGWAALTLTDMHTSPFGDLCCPWCSSSMGVSLQECGECPDPGDLTSG